MESTRATLVAFPQAGILGDNEEYHNAAQAHVKALTKLSSDAKWASQASQLIEQLDPSTHSLSYLYVLQTLKSANSYPLDDLLLKLTAFFTSFDARQIRYGGKAFTKLLSQPRLQDVFPASVAVELIATALLQLDPTGSVLTSHHTDLVRFAYMTNSVEPVLPIIEKNIVFYPGIRGYTNTRLLSDPDLPPSGFIAVLDHDFSKPLDTEKILEHDLLRGLCFIQRRSWQQAFDALERVITFPSRETNNASKIMVEAYNKWILVGLLLKGKAPVLPSITSVGPRKIYDTTGKPYYALAQAFEKRTAEAFKGEYEGLSQAFWDEEKNFSLLKLVIEHYQKWQILNLRHVYSKISLEQIRTRTRSGETAAPLGSVQEIEALVKGMIDEEILQGEVVHPENGGPAYLAFSSAADDLTEEEFTRRMVGAGQRIKELGPVVRATNERLASNKDYLKWLAQQKRQEQQQGQSQGGGAGEVPGFGDVVEDEDLMTGIVAG
ncbi:hypothetical protein QBC40DRAFT_264834 [Triangularia verruculosa]|uniref:COP9 signalosome complex subunit 3 n=1 Tax=Triangularia verruculosa TaxID=2587418 RepID=A0AAN6XH83_9PEZI|nr:hypothetical protein QBC40DRAFT_264834 [Triangularia verruculosa]